MNRSSIKKQQGFIFSLDVLMGLSVLIVIFTLIASIQNDNQLDRDAANFRDHVSRLVVAIKAYQADMYNAGVPFRSTAIFPATLNDLMPAYLPECSVSDNSAGRCKRPNQTPWGLNLDYRRELVSVPVPGGFADMPGFILEIPVGLEPTENYRHTYAAALAQLPFAKWDENTGLLTLKYGRLGVEIENEALIRRDGTSKLTGHWDVGGDFAIVNALDVTIKNSNGSQRSLGRGVISMMVAKNNQRIPRHHCPAGATPDLVTWPKALYPSNTSTSFNETGASTAFYTRSGNDFIIKLEYWAKRTSNHTWYKYTTGDVAVALICI